MRKTTVFSEYSVYCLQRSRTHNPLVEGSSPSGPTIFTRNFIHLPTYPFSNRCVGREGTAEVRRDSSTDTASRDCISTRLNRQSHDAYIAGLKENGQGYREIVGRSFPAMTAVEVTALVEDRAKAEIECSAVVDEDSV